MTGRVSVVYRSDFDDADGIGAHSEQLVSTLEHALGVPADLVDPARVSAQRGTAVILQYNPFSYGRWGFAPRLILRALRWRLGAPGVRLVLFVHEPYVAPHGVRTTLMATWHRLQLLLLRLLADAVLVPSGDARRRCGTWLRPAEVVPVGSNLPDRREDRVRIRRSLGAREDTIVLAVFGQSAAGRVNSLVTAAVRAVVAADADCCLVVLGPGHDAPAGLPDDVPVVQPGLLSLPDVAAMLGASDIFLAPYVDGVSTRRTTMMAALQHGLPIVGTTVGRSDACLTSSDALLLSDLDDTVGFATAAARLATGSAEREARSRAARALYDERFTWPVIAQKVLVAADGGA